jgi:hypothetical protein
MATSTQQRKVVTIGKGKPNFRAGSIRQKVYAHVAKRGAVPKARVMKMLGDSAPQQLAYLEDGEMKK